MDYFVNKFCFEYILGWAWKCTLCYFAFTVQSKYRNYLIISISRQNCSIIIVVSQCGSNDFIDDTWYRVVQYATGINLATPFSLPNLLWIQQRLNHLNCEISSRKKIASKCFKLFIIWTDIFRGTTRQLIMEHCMALYNYIKLYACTNICCRKMGAVYYLKDLGTFSKCP